MINATGNNPMSFGAGRIDAAMLASRQSDFASVLSRTGQGRLDGQGRPIEEPPVDAKKQAAEAARDFVAIALVQPVLAQMRAHNQAAPPFAPGPAEKQFGAIVDAQIARQIVRKSGYALVDRIAADLSKRFADDGPGAKA